MAPGAIAYAWLGYAGREAAAGNSAAVRYGLLALGLLGAVALLPSLARRLRGEETPRWIAADELAAGLDEAGGTAVVDVRGPDEFTGPLGHIREARNLPLSELPQRLHELSPPTNKRVVLVCHTDKRSAKAAAILRDAGFQDVLVLRGGMVRWNEAGMPVAHRLGEHRS
jgi:rhodanese-related sulfurtransferase